MRHCTRCGIDTPDSPFCLDCRELEVNLFRPISQSNPEREQILKERARSVKDLWMLGKTDVEISKILGISSRTALRWRQRLQLAANSHGGGDSARMTIVSHIGHQKRREKLSA